MYHCGVLYLCDPGHYLVASEEKNNLIPIFLFIVFSFLFCTIIALHNIQYMHIMRFIYFNNNNCISQHIYICKDIKGYFPHSVGMSLSTYFIYYLFIYDIAVTSVILNSHKFTSRFKIDFYVYSTRCISFYILVIYNQFNLFLFNY